MRLSMLAPVACLIALVSGRADAGRLGGLPPTSDGEGTTAALTQVTHDLCERRFALLGEGPTHGDGATEAFKVALVERLIGQCGYRSIVFEASQYEFFALRRRLRNGRPVTINGLAEALGGLRRSDEELSSLLPFLLSRARAGQVQLAGLDDQLGGAGDTYANDKMVPELAAGLPASRRAECIEDFRRRSYFDHTDSAPYSATDHQKLLDCLKYMADVGTQVPDVEDGPEHVQMIQALQRYVERDQSADREQWLARDQSMFETLEWLLAHGEVQGKTIVWGATVHLAKKDLDAKTGDFRLNFGSFMHSAFGDQAFVVGFSALGGSIRVNRSTTNALPAAPTGSLESYALTSTSGQAIYLGPQQLASTGLKEGAALDHTYRKVNWANLLDGLVIFSQEHPTHRLIGEVR